MNMLDFDSLLPLIILNIIRRNCNGVYYEISVMATHKCTHILQPSRLIIKDKCRYRLLKIRYEINFKM